MSDDSTRMFMYLKRLIQTSFVGVTSLCGDAVKEYFIDIDAGTTISFIVSKNNTDGIPSYQYLIGMGEDIIASAMISAHSKHLTREEEMIVRLFDLCSARVIFQETRGAIRAALESNRQKNRLN